VSQRGRASIAYLEQLAEALGVNAAVLIVHEPKGSGGERVSTLRLRPLRFCRPLQVRSREEVIAFAKSEGERAATARHPMSGRGAVARRRQVQDYADAMGKLLNIVEHGGPAILTPRGG
jgi:hypothetical protein